MARTAIPLSQARAIPSEPRLARGRCICGALQFTVRIAHDAAPTRCICARCRGADLRIAHAAQSGFALLTGAEDLTEPLSDPRNPHHFFCGRCGEPGFGHPGPGAVTVNLAMLDRAAREDEERAS